MHVFVNISFLYWSLVYLIKCFIAYCMQGRHLFWKGGHIFRLSGVCPISMFVFCFMHWSEGSVLFDWCLVSLVLNYFRAGRMWIVWFPSISPEISGPAAPAPYCIPFIREFQTSISFHRDMIHMNIPTLMFLVLIMLFISWSVHDRVPAIGKPTVTGTHVDLIGGHQWGMQLLCRARRLPSSPLA